MLVVFEQLLPGFRGQRLRCAKVVQSDLVPLSLPGVLHISHSTQRSCGNPEPRWPPPPIEACRSRQTQCPAPRRRRMRPPSWPSRPALPLETASSAARARPLPAGDRTPRPIASGEHRAAERAQIGNQAWNGSIRSLRGRILKATNDVQKNGAEESDSARSSSASPSYTSGGARREAGVNASRAAVPGPARAGGPPRLRWAKFCEVCCV